MVIFHDMAMLNNQILRFFGHGHHGILAMAIQGIRPATHRWLGGWKPGRDWLDSIRLAAEGGERSIPPRSGEAAQAEAHHPNVKWKTMENYGKPWKTMENHGLIGDEPWWYDILGPSIGFLIFGGWE